MAAASNRSAEDLNKGMYENNIPRVNKKNPAIYMIAIEINIFELNSSFGSGVLPRPAFL